MPAPLGGVGAERDQGEEEPRPADVQLGIMGMAGGHGVDGRGLRRSPQPSQAPA